MVEAVNILHRRMRGNLGRCGHGHRVAGLLQLSRRTLQRRLRDFGFSFEELIDDTRYVEAVRRLSTGTETMKEIAFMLGYSDQAHFNRAFRRWTGLAPRDYVERSQYRDISTPEGHNWMVQEELHKTYDASK